MAGLYVHIPFCKTRCGYCDFHTSTGLHLIKPLLGAIKKEIAYHKAYINNEPVDTIYFGGGTPSLLPEKELHSLFETIYSELEIAPDAEVTLEANPDDVTLQKLAFYKSLPINRLSVGIQSLNNDELIFMNRRHDAAQAIKAIDLAYNSGFENLTIDLIYGVPGQTRASWDQTLSKALQLPIKHLSSYSLMYEKGTPFYNMVQNNRLTPVEDERVLDMFTTLIEATEKRGLVQYEISNFARVGWESRHNSSYWNGKVYWGVGPSAHSYNGSNRQWNVSDNAAYIAAVNTGKLFFETETLSEDTRYNDFVITRMRTMEGCKLKELESAFGSQKRDYFMANALKFISSGHLLHDGETVKLAGKGIFISDHIMSELLLIS